MIEDATRLRLVADALLRGQRPATALQDHLVEFQGLPLETAAHAGAVLAALVDGRVPRSAARCYTAYVVLRKLVEAPGPEARAALAARGVPVLDEFARQHKPASPAWGLALHLLAVVGTPDSLSCWADRFLDRRAGPGAAHDLACAALLDRGPQAVAPLLGRLEAALSCPARRPYVQALAGLAPLPDPTGRPAAGCSVVARREVTWPGTGRRRRLYLVRCPFFDAAGLGFGPGEPFCDVVGVRPLDLPFRHSLGRLRPDDAFGLACYEDLALDGVVLERDLYSDDEYEAHLRERWRGGPLDEVKARFAAEPSHRLGYGGQVIVVGAARRGGEPGRVVLDGPRSAWYPECAWPPKPSEDRPSDLDPRTVLGVHVGRRLLALAGRRDGEESALPQAG